MKLAYFSPLSPLKSGISDYSEKDSLPFLNKSCGIDIFIDNGYEPTDEFTKENFKIFNYKKFNPANYDSILFHLGNNPYHEYIYNVILQNEGVVVVHDPYIGHLIAAMTLAKGDRDGYIDHLTYCLGEKGKTIAENAIRTGHRPDFEYPLINKVADSSRALIVHSDFAKKIISKECPNIIIKKINHPIPLDGQKTNSKKEDFGISKDTFVISTIGFVTIHKRLPIILRSFKKFLESFPNSKFLIVGSFSGDEYKEQINELLKELQISEKVIETGFVKDLKPYIEISDVAIQTRYPTAGETSGATLQIMSMKKPVIVSNIGWFQELPDNTVLKLNIEDNELDSICNSFIELASNKELRDQLGINAYHYIQSECDPEKIAYEVLDFISKINDTTFCKFIQNLSNKISELGFTFRDSNYLEILSENLQDIDIDVLIKQKNQGCEDLGKKKY